MPGAVRRNATGRRFLRLDNDDALTACQQPFKRCRVDLQTLAHSEPKKVLGTEHRAPCDPKRQGPRWSPRGEVDCIADVVPDDEDHGSRITDALPVSREFESATTVENDAIDARVYLAGEFANAGPGRRDRRQP